jgi:hypothetical protein
MWMPETGPGWFNRTRAKKTSSPETKSAEAGKSRPRRSGIMALEPRMMYDAAAVATVGAAAQTHTDGAADHATIAAAEQHAAPASNTGADALPAAERRACAKRGCAKICSAVLTCIAHLTLFILACQANANPRKKFRSHRMQPVFTEGLRRFDLANGNREFRALKFAVLQVPLMEHAETRIDHIELKDIVRKWWD